MTNHDHGIGAEPSWKSIEKILSAIVLDFLLIYSQALCYSTHIVVVNGLSSSTQIFTMDHLSINRLGS